MIKRKDIMFLRHDKDKQLIGFSYEVKEKEGNKECPCFLVEWTKGVDVGVWRMRIILDSERVPDSQIYRINYQMPRDGLPVELVAATGLKYFQMCLKEEIQQKSNFDFTLGELLKDM